MNGFVMEKMIVSLVKMKTQSSVVRKTLDIDLSVL